MIYPVIKSRKSDFCCWKLVNMCIQFEAELLEFLPAPPKKKILFDPTVKQTCIIEYFAYIRPYFSYSKVNGSVDIEKKPLIEKKNRLSEF